MSTHKTRVSPMEEKIMTQKHTKTIKKNQVSQRTHKKDTISTKQNKISTKNIVSTKKEPRQTKDWYQGLGGTQYQTKQPHTHQICGKCHACKTCKLCKCKTQSKKDDAESSPQQANSTRKTSLKDKPENCESSSTEKGTPQDSNIKYPAFRQCDKKRIIEAITKHNTERCSRRFCQLGTSGNCLTNILEELNLLEEKSIQLHKHQYQKTQYTETIKGKEKQIIMCKICNKIKGDTQCDKNIP